MKISLKGLTKKVMKNIFLKLMFIILKNYMTFIMIYYFYQKEYKLRVEKLVTNLHDKTVYVIHKTNLKQAWVSFEKSS